MDCQYLMTAIVLCTVFMFEKDHVKTPGNIVFGGTKVCPMIGHL